MDKRNYIFYEKTKPFPGWIRMHGKVDLNMPPDGSTLRERLDQLLIKYPNADYKVFLERRIKFFRGCSCDSALV